MQGRVVVITGSTRGIGRALAAACAKRGARVVVHGRDESRVAEVARELGAIGIAADLATASGAETLVARAIAECGRIDVLVNNAAVSPPRVPLWETEPAVLADAIAINVTAPILTSRALLAHAVPCGEAVRIVNVSSGLASLPRDRAAAYVATKAALDGFTQALALDGDHVTVTAVALGGYQTELSRQMLGDDELAALPDATAAVGHLLHAITGPAEHVHGRVLGPRDPELDVSAIDLLAHPLGPSPAAREALAAVARTGALDRYPERDHGELRKLLAAHHGVPLDAITLGGGISELIDRVLRLATRPGEALVANAPSWPVLAHACHTHGLAWRRVPYRLIDNRVDHDLDAILASIDRGVRVVYLTSPGNPGGRALDAAPFARFLAQLPEHVTVLVDEAYADFTARAEALRAVPLTQTTDRLIVLRSFSKLYGLAGLRIGYAVSARERARVIARAAPVFPVVRGAAEAAVAALSDHAHSRRVIAEVLAARGRLEARLDERGIARLASDAPFVLAADPAAPGPRYFDRYVMLPAWAENA